ncbi:MAG: NnrS family protein [Rhodoferax sp.]|uniref:NnrS family protein n=1 Tax=Rhodoferax sp. TaxID=50421 RepID=UPI00271E130C|nr:NnrS family protein [Rhodoferax sp.]MDO8447471.1 NnrS family protein [Rhodoferax sp.]
MKSNPITPASTSDTSRAAKIDVMALPWRPIWLLAAPHRLAFFMASLMLVASSLWWGFILAARSLNMALFWAVPVSAAHALLMTMGFMPLFFVGFLFTAGPRWLGLPEVNARSLLPGLTLMLGGWVVVLIGFHTHVTVACAGMSLVAAGWTGLALKFLAMLRRSHEPDRVHARAVTLASGVGVIALWMTAVSLAVDSELLLRTATQVGLWGFIAPVFAIVSHRMIPFFGASAVQFLDAWRPMWLLWLMVCMFWMKAVLSAADLWWWPVSITLRWCQVALELPYAFLLLWLALRWGLVQSLKIRLIAMLHGGFAWLAISFALHAVSHALMALTNGELSLGLAPLHAMTMGYLGATMFAMTTRLSSGHGGRPVAADNPAWTLYWILQMAVLLRVVAAIWPAASTPLTLLSISAWTAATAGWAIRYGRWFGRPRLDGRPG